MEWSMQMNAENKKNPGIVWRNTISLQELLFCLFFGILLFAKGIGLYDGQGIFKVFLLLAFLCWFGKMLISSHTVMEDGIIALLVAIGLLVWHFSGEKAALISVLVVTGMKDVSVKRVFQTGLVVWTACFAGTICLALTGVIEPLMLVHNKAGMGFVIRNSLGYTHPNVLHISFVILISFWFYFYAKSKKGTLAATALAFVGNIYIFLYSLSYTGFIVTTAYLILLTYFSLRSERTKAENVIIQCLMPLCVLTSLLAPHLLKGRIFELADKLVNTRFTLTRRALIVSNLSLFGKRIDIGEGSVDCSYVYCLLYYGIILFGIFMIGYFLLIRHLLKENRTRELALVLGLVAAGFTEPFQFNFSFKNLILPFLGEYLFVLTKYLDGKFLLANKAICLFPCQKAVKLPGIATLPHLGKLVKSIWKKAGICIFTGCLIGGIMGASVGWLFIEVKPYVVVDRKYSDRVGRKEDFEIFGELPEEIVENSMQIHCTGPDAHVYVFEGGNMQRLERVRNSVSCGAAGMIIAGIGGCWIGNIKYQRKRIRNLNDI
ncbi:MAG: hypothetical protein Q4C58_06985 [Eubacteriales bacterium]|nr:hypothetical protein [Eubacteriales bacterium]